MDISNLGSLNQLVDGTFHNFTLLTHALTNDLTKLKERAKGIECKISTETEIGYAIPICLTDFKKPYCGCEGVFDMRSCPYGLSGTKCRSSSLIKCCVEKCNKQLDLVRIYLFLIKWWADDNIYVVLMLNIGQTVSF